MNTQQIIKSGNFAVVINSQDDFVWANMYVNARNGLQNADITRIKTSGKSLAATIKWANKKLAEHN